MSNHDIESLFDAWNAALKTGDPQRVASLYAHDSILLPTMSNRVRRTPAEIVDYFEDFLSNQPEGKLEDSNIRIFDDVAINSGVYVFSFGDGSKARARFTFVYRWDEERWLIIDHHSSQMPEG